MKLTNKLRLPEPIRLAIANDSYTKGNADISVTELLTPPQLRMLKLRHYDELEEDVSDRIWSLLGQATHTIIERAGMQSLAGLSEEIISSEYSGWLVKGQSDHVALDEATLYDFKVTSVWKVRDEIVPEEWVQQTNIYRRLLNKEKGITVNSIAIIAILRDWSKNEAARTPGYPTAQVIRLEVPVWSDEHTDAFIEERIRLHKLSDPPPCTAAERWTKPSKYAVMKRGNVRAIKLFDLQEDAEALASTSAALYVEYRPGESVRCANWCPVSRYCQQWLADPLNKPKTNLTENLFNA